MARKSLSLVMLLVAMTLMVGCTTVSTQSRVDTPSGMVAVATGDLTVVARKTTTTTTKDAAGKVLSTTTEVVEEQSAKSAPAGDQEVKLRREQRKEAVGVAKVSHGSFWNWLFTPVPVSTYGYGGGVVANGSCPNCPAGNNVVYHN